MVLSCEWPRRASASSRPASAPMTLPVRSRSVSDRLFRIPAPTWTRPASQCWCLCWVGCETRQREEAALETRIGRPRTGSQGPREREGGEGEKERASERDRESEWCI
eukprot:516278-Rhodomonas_salina.3